jgi:hypothetical protein
MSHYPPLALLTGITLALSACGTGPELDVTIHESERGAVYLERVTDRSFHAAHPIAISTDTMARILRGVVVKEKAGLLLKMLGAKPEAVRAFEDEEVEYLAPLLVEGLARAASDQQVGFRVGQTKASDGSTKGSLYAYGQSLYLTAPWLIPLSRYGAGGPTPAPTILFVPESAKRQESYRDARSTDATLVIDYELLATMPAVSEMQPTAAQPQTPVMGKPAQRDADLDSLRKELQDIKKKLDEQEAERNRSGPSSAPKP